MVVSGRRARSRRTDGLAPYDRRVSTFFRRIVVVAALLGFAGIAGLFLTRERR